ncbi:hypothetical protein [Pseudomonas sp. RGM2987]|uniref:hypothetical protein n=1 Tax=Pseudomonas sp. RGM2987 TaxID=2930090 RepID=UPI0032AF13A2
MEPFPPLPPPNPRDTHKRLAIPQSGDTTMSFGGASLAASMAAMQQMDATSAAMTTMKSQFDQKKLVADTMNAISAESMDSATKAITAMGEASKNIRF